MHTKCLLDCYIHLYRLLLPSNESDRRPVGEDGDFGEDIELKHYMTAEEKMESGRLNFLRYMWKALTSGWAMWQGGQTQSQEEPRENMRTH